MNADSVFNIGATHAVCEDYVIAGTRDTGLMQAAESAATPEALQELASHNTSWRGFEALYEFSASKTIVVNHG